MATLEQQVAPLREEIAGFDASRIEAEQALAERTQKLADVGERITAARPAPRPRSTLCQRARSPSRCSATMPSCATRHGHADENRAGPKPHGKHHPPRTKSIARPGSQLHGLKERQNFAAQTWWHDDDAIVPRREGHKCAPLPLATTFRLSSVRHSMWAESRPTAAQHGSTGVAGASPLSSHLGR